MQNFRVEVRFLHFGGLVQWWFYPTKWVVEPPPPRILHFPERAFCTFLGPNGQKLGPRVSKSRLIALSL